MTWVRRCCALALLVGATAWVAFAVTAAHSSESKILLALGGGHGVVASDLPRALVWALVAVVSVRAMR
ncbi:hypothetical protein [Nocardioides zeae]|uniref:Uncharacterized protein n=1 Tax=Nocardioides zeae TaxID=1457234 RepID=A0A6P0HNZ6_9ACTN|nr:hypothetical protein [Nocardioides zeae]NEN79964.1 hypothetical protein [Nocardioides zeae]